MIMGKLSIFITKQWIKHQENITFFEGIEDHIHEKNSSEQQKAI